MRKIFILSFILFSFTSSRISAQAPFTTTDSIDINNFHVPMSVHGRFEWNDSCLNIVMCPTRRKIRLIGNPWISGYDAGNNLHISAQTYKQDGTDYWPGPLDVTGNLDYTTSQKWAKVWKVKGTDVQYFNSLSVHTVSNTPPTILTWPAKGNIYAMGNGGAPLTITNDMAPFVDLNSNGIYEPLLGEYPDFPGDEALWHIFSDNGPTHTLGNGAPLGVEIHSMLYAYNRGTLIDNVVYIDYAIINRSGNNYHNFRLAHWDDVAIGWYNDDFIGFDSSRRMAIQYNGTDDDGGGGGHPVNSYGIYPPQLGITMIVLPGDAGTNYLPAGSFNYYNNDASIIGNPVTATDFDNYMRSKLKDGSHFTNDFQGRGIPSKGYGSGPDCNYIYTGDPGDSTQWSECSCNNNPSDRHLILTSNDFTLNTGSTQHIILALLQADSVGGCPSTSFSKVKTICDTAWNAYYHPPAPLHRSDPVGIANVNTYPNPVHNILYMEDRLHDLGNAKVTVYNYLGNVIYVPISQNGQRLELNISSLPVGLYYSVYKNGNTQTRTKFLKE